MSTKSKIQKVRAEIEAHEGRGWLKGYEEGLANREEEVRTLHATLEARNERIRELRAKKNGPKNSREALDLAWELAHPVKEGQHIPEGTRYVRRSQSGGLTTFTATVGWTPTRLFAGITRILDPLPDPEPDWLNAPAVLASHPVCADTEQIGIWIPSDKDGMWEWPIQQGEFMAHWSELEDVTPLYPKEEQESMISIHKNCGSQVSTDEKDITHLDGDGESSGYSAACLKCDEDLFPFEVDQVPASEVS